ncbi:MAG: hypothetical protein PHE53_02155 [Thermoguttaceae bacterium]|nr:hypothetical protein [Thermoguttaceae bacterium]
MVRMISGWTETEFLKGYTCVWCGAKYLCNIRTTVSTGRHYTRAAVDKALDKAVSKEHKHNTGFVPCPCCGVYHPAMVAWHQRKSFESAFIVLFVLLFLSGAFFWGAQKSPGWAVFLMTIEALLVIAYLVFVSLRDPNTDQAKNLAKAQKCQAEGVLKLIAPATIFPETEEGNEEKTDEEGDDEEDEEIFPGYPDYRVLQGILLLAGIFLLIGELYRAGVKLVPDTDYWSVNIPWTAGFVLILVGMVYGMCQIGAFRRRYPSPFRS